MTPTIIIPAYQPDDSLITLADTLRKHGAHLIVVNDGSGKDYDAIFSKLRSDPNITILNHAVNLGKGQALKTAFNYFLTHASDNDIGVITADADGQHLPDDILKVWHEFERYPQELILGCRTFSQSIPWRSRFGNTLTCKVYKLFIGQTLQDTQTGLRAIPKEFMKKLLRTPSTGYEFELDMLILASQEMNIRETPITTVYKDNNKSSHFNPLIDSLKIYFVFFRYLAFSIISGLFDFFAFSMAFFLCQNILFSEILARTFSGTCNFLFNKGLVFKSNGNMLPEAVKYAGLCLANLLFSYGFISGLVYLGMSVYASKLIALAGLFLANFAIQRVMIFSRTAESIPTLS